MPVASHEELLTMLKKRLAEFAEENDREWHKNYGKNMAYLRGKSGKPLRVVAESANLALATVWRLEQGKAKWQESYAKAYLDAIK